MMLRSTTTLRMLLCAGIMLPLSVSAQVLGGNEGAMPLPPPPGPYISSRPQLETSSVAPRGNNRMPVFGNMPALPMHYMPPSNQLPTPPPWWRGPMGR